MNRPAITVTPFGATSEEAVKRAPATEPIANTVRGGMMSGRLTSALTSVPATNPSCTDMVNQAMPEGDSSNCRASAGATAVPANQRLIPSSSANEIHANCHTADCGLPDPGLPVGFRLVPRNDMDREHSWKIHRVATVATVGMIIVAGAPLTAQLRPEFRGRHAVVAAGRSYTAEAGARMIAQGGNAIDAGVASIFAAAVTEISHFGLGGEAPIIIYSAREHRVVVINGQGSAPRAATPALFEGKLSPPGNGPLGATIPA